MARTPMFVSLFEKSPLAPVQEHLTQCGICTTTLRSCFEAAFVEDWETVEKLYHDISMAEQEADTLKRELRTTVSRSLLMPISREDLLELVGVQDRIANVAQDIAGLVLGRKMAFPNQLHDGLTRFLTETSHSLAIAQNALEDLVGLAKMGFTDKALESIDREVEKLHESERTADALQREVRSELFKIETELNPVDVMFIYRILEHIGEVSDSAHSAGNRMLFIAHS
ncbi:MAG: TIGR00153 family protein [Pseudomonadales bacterium]|nr:TIGR00153 family protein [Pseudomonadales bacterium]MBO6563149.1 TIGR00153 family protein [Pseudomonadales bacterium]MBO6596902.1 TIGR00153 family protein [Pseudomonadales bacterium]MBO6823109.1 TIGR00153 family protein [Pseudomonadales bacterium]